MEQIMRRCCEMIYVCPLLRGIVGSYCYAPAIDLMRRCVIPCHSVVLRHFSNFSIQEVLSCQLMMEKMNRARSALHLWLMLNKTFCYESTTLRLVHFKWSMLKCDILFAHFILKVVSIQFNAYNSYTMTIFNITVMKDDILHIFSSYYCQMI